MLISGIPIRVKCDIILCRLRYIVFPELSCSLCKYYKPVDLPKIAGEIIKARTKADNDGKEIYEIIVDEDKIDRIIYTDIWENVDKCEKCGFYVAYCDGYSHKCKDSKVIENERGKNLLDVQKA